MDVGFFEQERRIRDAETARANAETARADAERQARLAAEERIRLLEAELERRQET